MGFDLESFGRCNTAPVGAPYASLLSHGGFPTSQCGRKEEHNVNSLFLTHCFQLMYSFDVYCLVWEWANVYARNLK